LFRKSILIRRQTLKLKEENTTYVNCSSVVFIIPVQLDVNFNVEGSQIFLQKENRKMTRALLKAHPKAGIKMIDV
jgi:hypothetical protein